MGLTIIFAATLSTLPCREAFLSLIPQIQTVFTIAVSVPGVAIVWSVIGSSLGMIIGFIIPGACYLKIRGKKGIWRPTNLGALILMIFSVVVAIVCSIQTIMAPTKE
jgi:amino acid permease